MKQITKIGVLGAGVEGLETVKYLVKHGYEDITLYDEKEEAE